MGMELTVFAGETGETGKEDKRQVG
jgi:hypothetical protein